MNVMKDRYDLVLPNGYFSYAHIRKGKWELILKAISEP